MYIATYIPTHHGTHSKRSGSSGVQTRSRYSCDVAPLRSLISAAEPPLRRAAVLHKKTLFMSRARVPERSCIVAFIYAASHSLGKVQNTVEALVAV